MADSVGDSDRYIGRPMKRVEDPKLITGKGQYVDDVRLPGTAYVAFVRSPHANARVIALDVEAARRAPGVITVVTADELKTLRPLPLALVVPGLKQPPYSPLAEGHVQVVGTPVAAVLAERPAVARDAADLVEVEYEPRPAITDPVAALQPGAPLVHPDFGTNQAYTLVTKGGDVESALKSADHIVRVRVNNARLAGAPLEPRGILAHYNPGTEELTVWATTQTPFRVRGMLAAVLNIPETKIRVIAPEVGGGFGVRGTYREEVVVAALARASGRPVKWIATRNEDILTTLQGRGVITEGEAALTKEGKITALKVRVIYNMGAHLITSSLVPPTRLPPIVTGAYQIPNVLIETTGVFTNAAPTGPYRGAARPPAAMLIERVMDEAARILAIDPAEIRRRNFIPVDVYPYKAATGQVHDSGNHAKTLARALDLLDYDGFRRRQAEARKRGEILGVGVSTYIDPSGGNGWESGLVRVEASGKVTALTGSSPHGQGHDTTFAQVVADHLGVSFEDVTVRHGDTLGVPPGIGTFGSRSAAMGGSAIAKAAMEVREKGRRFAAAMLEAGAEDIQPVRGGFQVKGVPDKKVSWGQIAGFAYRGLRLPPGETAGMEATVFYTQELEMMSFGACLATVKVDPETGSVHLERLISVDDCGHILNPLLVHGQTEGGLVQGIGQAMLEKIVYGDDGQLLTGTFMDYAMPRADDVPPMTLESTVTPSPLNPLGVKGAGEAGAVAAPPAIVSAVVDALSPFGVTHLDMPLTPENIWQAINSVPPNAR